MFTPVLENATGTAGFVAIKPARFMFKGEITAHPSNAGDVLIRKAPAGDQIHLPAGTIKYCYDPTDLSQLQISGNTYVLILDGVTEPGW